ncbi:MAG: transcriptional regulator [Burkholderiales bacterium PBB5]|nr:MAG: transcriptional regulator [Burkholderiales bacterium PBB5]
MVNLTDQQLDRVFAALSDTTRRAVLGQLGAGGATVSELAQPHGMSLPGFMKHLAVLEAAGLIARSKAGRVVRCELDAAPMQEAAVWLARYERYWQTQLDALGRYLQHQEDTSPCKTPSSSKPRPKSESSDATPSRSTRSGVPGLSRKR